MNLSIVVPIYNEVENIPLLYEALNGVLSEMDRTCELLFVDDGSSDGSNACLVELARQDPRVRIVEFRNNFGQTAAMAAGIQAARGDVIVTLDGDMQNDPADIPMLLSEIDAGYDLVHGWRKNRQDAFLSRKLPSRIANALISRVTRFPVHDLGCTLKAIRREVAQEIPLYGEMHRFIPALASEMGVRVDEMVVNHRPRTRGRSKYGLSRTVRVILDLMTVKFLLSYSTRPLQMFGLLGLLMGGAGLAVTGWLAYLRLFGNQPIGDRPLLLFGILLIFTGVQLGTLGLLAELQARTYHESQDKPTYVIREILE